jgi:hypothetical protein
MVDNVLWGIYYLFFFFFCCSWETRGGWKSWESERCMRREVINNVKICRIHGRQILDLATAFMFESCSCQNIMRWDREEGKEQKTNPAEWKRATLYRHCIGVRSSLNSTNLLIFLSFSKEKKCSGKEVSHRQIML